MWPYLPRQDHPSVPNWLMILILVLAVAVYIGFIALVGHSEIYKPAHGPVQRPPVQHPFP
jgi:hypothetical protein